MELVSVPPSRPHGMRVKVTDLRHRIAMIIGCCPGLYRMFKANSIKKKSTYNSHSYGYGYGKSNSRRVPLGSSVTCNDTIQLQPRSDRAAGITKTMEFNVSTSAYDDATSSQEELTAQQMFAYPGGSTS